MNFTGSFSTASRPQIKYFMLLGTDHVSQLHESHHSQASRRLHNRKLAQVDKLALTPFTSVWQVGSCPDGSQQKRLVQSNMVAGCSQVGPER